MNLSNIYISALCIVFSSATPRTLIAAFNPTTTSFATNSQPGRCLYTTAGSTITGSAITANSVHRTRTITAPFLSTIPLQQPNTVPSHLSSSTSLSLSSTTENNTDPTIRSATLSLRRTSWFSWWSQVILTTISSITLLFARGVNRYNTAATAGTAGNPLSVQNSSSLFFAGSGIALSILSILWTWGSTRLSRRLLRNQKKNSSQGEEGEGEGKKPYSQIDVAIRIRRVVSIGTTLNVLGMAVTLVGAEQIIGTLAAKALTMSGLGNFGAGGVGAIASQTLQPLDILVVQANTNTLLSHFASLVGCLFLNRSVERLDPPSREGDERGR